jgi:hypothetical protein
MKLSGRGLICRVHGVLFAEKLIISRILWYTIDEPD